MFRIFSCLLFWNIVFSPLLLYAGEKSARELVDSANQLLRGQSSHSDISMTITAPSWERTLRVEIWNLGRDKALMRIHSPLKERGNGTLKIKNEIWDWLPNVEKIIKIPPSMMHSYWMGSDFTYEDVVKADSLVKDYTHKILERIPLEGLVRYKIEADPIPDAPVVWGRVILNLRDEGDEILPESEEDYSERGELMRRVSFSEVRSMGGRRIPSRLECVPLKRTGHKTRIEYHQFEADISYPPVFFSLRNLEKPLK